MGQVSEEAATYGRQLDAGFSQEGSDSLERGRGAVLCFLLESQLSQLYSLWTSAVALAGKQTKTLTAIKRKQRMWNISEYN